MILITGGAYQDKVKFARSIIHKKEPHMVSGADCTLEDVLSADIVNRFHLLVKRNMSDSYWSEPNNWKGLIHKWQEDNPSVVIIADELGCGLVPIEKKDREYRELSGRVCSLIGKRAKVFRVTCGIGVMIKDDTDLDD